MYRIGEIVKFPSHPIEIEGVSHWKSSENTFQYQGCKFKFIGFQGATIHVCEVIE